MPNKGVTSRSLHKHAVAFVDVVNSFTQLKKIDPLVKQFILARAIELLLKSFLIERGVTIKTLKSRDYGHNIDSLFQKCIELGLKDFIGRNHTHRGVIDLLQKQYREKELEYRIDRGKYTLLNDSVIMPFVKRLIQGVDFAIKRKY